MAQRLSNPDRYDEIREEVANFIEDFGIEAYPFSIWVLLRQMGIRLIPYSMFPDQLRSEVERAWPDAITLRPDNFNAAETVIFYNDQRPRERIRFTLAHELAHLVLEHPDEESDELEGEADIFANYLLAPAPLILRDSSVNSYAIEADFVVSHGCALSARDRTAKRRDFGPRHFTEYEVRILKTARLVKGGGRVA